MKLFDLIDRRNLRPLHSGKWYRAGALLFLASALCAGPATADVLVIPGSAMGCPGLGFVDYITVTPQLNVDTLCSHLRDSILNGVTWQGPVPAPRPWEVCTLAGGTYVNGRCVLPPASCPSCAKPPGRQYDALPFNLAGQFGNVFLEPGDYETRRHSVPCHFRHVSRSPERLSAPKHLWKSGQPRARRALAGRRNGSLLGCGTTTPRALRGKPNRSSVRTWELSTRYRSSRAPSAEAAAVPEASSWSRRVKDRLVAYWHPDYTDQWLPMPAPQASVSGSFALIQSRFGGAGNFELVTPLKSGGMQHFWRDNNAPGLPWKPGKIFGQELGYIDAVTMIQSTYSASGNGLGNFELVVRAGNRLAAYWLPDNSDQWLPMPAPQIAVSGNPSLIESRFGRSGNFELVVPLASGGLAHLWRDNDTPGLPWNLARIFGVNLGKVNSVSLIQTTLSASGNGLGNLELVARTAGGISTFWHPDNLDDRPPAPAVAMLPAPVAASLNPGSLSLTGLQPTETPGIYTVTFAPLGTGLDAKIDITCSQSSGGKTFTISTGTNRGACQVRYDERGAQGGTCTDQGNTAVASCEKGGCLSSSGRGSCSAK